MTVDVLARAIRERKEAMERIAVAIHEAALQLRMMPVAQVFRSFPRAVRDLAQQLGKDVTFVTLGETTEADKTIVRPAVRTDHAPDPQCARPRDRDPGPTTCGREAATGTINMRALAGRRPADRRSYG